MVTIHSKAPPPTGCQSSRISHVLTSEAERIMDCRTQGDQQEGIRGTLAILKLRGSDGFDGFSAPAV